MPLAMLFLSRLRFPRKKIVHHRYDGDCAAIPTLFDKQIYILMSTYYRQRDFFSCLQARGEFLPHMRLMDMAAVVGGPYHYVGLYRCPRHSSRVKVLLPSSCHCLQVRGALLLTMRACPRSSLAVIVWGASMLRYYRHFMAPLPCSEFVLPCLIRLPMQTPFFRHVPFMRLLTPPRHMFRGDDAEHLCYDSSPLPPMLATTSRLWCGSVDTTAAVPCLVCAIFSRVAGTPDAVDAHSAIFWRWRLSERQARGSLPPPHLPALRLPRSACGSSAEKYAHMRVMSRSR